MAIKQLSVFVENKKGSLHEITDTLAAAGVDLRSMCVADTANFGIVRIITDESDRAKELLDKAGHAANVREINAFAVPDVPGGLAKVLKYLTDEKISVEYMYAFLARETSKALMVLKADDESAAEKTLRLNGIEMLDPKDL